MTELLTKFVSRAWRKLKKPQILGVVLIVAFAAMMVAPVLATSHTTEDPTAGDDSQNFIGKIITYVVEAYLKLATPLLIMLVNQVVWVSGYSDFVNSLPVITGWVIVRDVANMFFIIVLLIVAFGTILGQEQYHYKKLLPKLLVLAVLVNFSRTIVGVFTDAAQVVMLTFVNGYSAAAGGNFAQMFGVLELLKVDQGCLRMTEGGMTLSAVTVGYLLAAVMVTISIITIMVILAVLILRVIMLWLLTILSPLAFLAGTFPQGQKYYAQWWQEFTNQAVVGPMLAFFLWLSLVTAGGGNSANLLNDTPDRALSDTNSPRIDCQSAGTSTTVASFIISIMMLLAGVQMSQQMGGAISGVAGRAKGFATKFVKSGFGARYAWKYGGKQAAGFLDRQQGRFTGIQLAKIPGRFKEALAERRKKTEEAIQMRGYRLAGRAREIVGRAPVVGRFAAGLYGAMAAPDVLVNTFLTRGFGARLARGFRGSGYYKERHADKAEAELKEAKAMEDGYKTNKTRLADIEEYRGLHAAGAAARTLEQQARYQKLQQQLGTDFGGLIQQRTAAQAVVASYEGPDGGAERVAALRASALQHQAKYARGEMPYEQTRENMLFRLESEAMKRVDLTRSTNELVGDLQRAVAKRDKGATALLAKELSKRGDISDALEGFGITERGVPGLERFREEVLVQQAGLDPSHANKTAVRMTEHAFGAGNFDYGNAYKIDPLTNEIKANSPEEAAKVTARRWAKKPLATVVQNLDPKALVQVGPDGRSSPTPIFAALVAKMSAESPESLASLFKGARFASAEIARTLKSQLGVLRQLQSAGIRPETVQEIERVHVAPPGPSLADRTAEIIAAMRGNQPQPPPQQPPPPQP